MGHGIQPGGDQRGAGVFVPLCATGRDDRTQANRFFMELVNTQTAPEVGTATAAGFNPVVDLGGFVYNPVADASVSGTPDPYTGAPWDIIFTGDDPYSRPDPYRGQLVPYANLYAATPLSQASFTPRRQRPSRRRFRITLSTVPGARPAARVVVRALALGRRRTDLT